MCTGIPAMTVNKLFKRLWQLFLSRMQIHAATHEMSPTSGEAIAIMLNSHPVYYFYNPFRKIMMQSRPAVAQNHAQEFCVKNCRI
jgi:hypothetical protein